MVARKVKSKRFTTRHRAKVERKLREHRRKLNREAKVKKGRKTRKDPGIPSLLPYKEEFIQTMQAEREKEKLQRKLVLARNDIHGLATQAAAKQASYQSINRTDPKAEKFFDASKRAFYREFKQVVNNSDVILEVLDARDPQGTRVQVVEDLVASSGGRKRIILILNKIDLVPREVVRQWLNYFRRELPAIAFRSSTSTTAVGSSLGTAECLGANTLIHLLKNYCRNQEIKTSIRVGVVGYPNVGKSSLINSLKRAKVCKVGATAGITTASQEIHLDRNITLLDCPGIVFAFPKDANEAAHLFLRNCLKIEQITNPIISIELILTKTRAETLMTLYTIPLFTNVNEFLSLIAQRMGRLKKGGIPNIEAAAKVVLNDWNRGKIPFYTLPPADATTLINDATIVDDWAPKFDIEAINKMEVDTVLCNIPVDLPMAQSIDIGPIDQSHVNSPLLPKIKNTTDYKITVSAAESELNPQRNKIQVKKFKEAQKTERKATRRVTFTEEQSSMILDPDMHDFNTEFNNDINKP